MSSQSLQTSPDPAWGGKGVLDGELEADAGPPPSSQPGSEISFLAGKRGSCWPSRSQSTYTYSTFTGISSHGDARGPGWGEVVAVSHREALSPAGLTPRGAPHQ